MSRVSVVMSLMLLSACGGEPFHRDSSISNEGGFGGENVGGGSTGEGGVGDGGMGGTSVSSSSGGPCIPKTCLTQNKNCGIISDLCENMIDCGECAQDPANMTVCGGLPAPDEDGNFEMPQANVCAGGCTKQENVTDCQDFYGAEYPFAYLCSQTGNSPNDMQCTSLPGQNFWCCKYLGY